MEQSCTCSAALPPDARFCHKCGKPQFDSPVIEHVDTPEPAELPPPPPPVPVEINFHNPIAVRIALLAALIGSLVAGLPIPVPGWILLSLTGVGFVSVYFYSRRTGQSLSVLHGAQMGWICGVFSFMIGTVFFTLSTLAIVSDGNFEAFYRKAMQQQMGSSSADLDKVMELLRNPVTLGVILVGTLLIMFVMFTVLPAVGGALGAKMMERDRV